MIIIKTQDGTILEVKQITPMGTQIVSGQINTEVSDGIGGVTSVCNYESLGVYTEERAKVVMSMIENHIEVRHSDSKINKAIPCTVFKMPKE